GIIDLFPPPASPVVQGPLRLDFSGDTVKSIRLFDPLSQRSQEELEEAILLPGSDILFPSASNASAQEKWRKSLYATAKEFAAESRQIMQQLREQIRFPGIEFFLPLIYQDPKPQTLFDYLPAHCPCILHDPIMIRRKIVLVWERIAANYEDAGREASKEGGFALPPQTLFLEAEELEQCLGKRVQVDLCLLPDPDAAQAPIHQQVGDHSLLRQEIELQRKKRGVLAPLADRLLQWQKAGDTVVLACRSERQAAHLDEMLADYGIECAQGTTPLDLQGQHPGQVFLVEHPLTHGFDLPEEQLHILSAAELFGDKRLLSSRKRGQGGQRPQGEPVALEEINIGDTVVHQSWAG
ncbi:transcription-repair coupling factor, partial [Desulfobulbus sp. TB]|nr:transcription-repair coupling factor [Desulfobulbus sp. TB]